MERIRGQKNRRIRGREQWKIWRQICVGPLREVQLWFVEIGRDPDQEIRIGRLKWDFVQV